MGAVEMMKRAIGHGLRGHEDHAGDHSALGRLRRALSFSFFGPSSDDQRREGEDRDRRAWPQERGALALLKRDHEVVAGLFAQLLDPRGQQGDREMQEGLFAQLRYELEAHALVEEEHFYAAVRTAIGAGGSLIETALLQHEQMRALLAEADEALGQDEAFHRKLFALKLLVDRHVSEEEGDLFREARLLLGKDELLRLGERMDQAKRAGDTPRNGGPGPEKPG